MDFWSRLIGGSRSTPSSKSLRTYDPVGRLATFKRTCNSLLGIWRTAGSPADETTILQVRSCLERLNAVLGDESRGPAPHPCLLYASTSQIYMTVTKLALTAPQDEALICAAAVFFNNLIDAEVDGIVDSRNFSRALVDLIRRAAITGEEIEIRLVELLFGVANNIRLQPIILPAWFHPKEIEFPDKRQPVAEEKQFAGATRKDDFPLFYLLVDFVHHEGRPGDFARTGLLYIIETASRSRELEKWLIESDLATLMATGLGALYSQLNRNPTESATGNIPSIIALSDEARVEMAVLGSDMDSFLSYLLFWQDTVDHCRSVEVNDTLLDHFEVIFLQQLLYPSLLESSDVEGGSTSAVLTYLCRILEAIDQPELIHRILHFLLASPTAGGETIEIISLKEHMSLSRRKSLDILAAFAVEAAKPSPSLFNLVDLILMSVRSPNQETLVATLRLVTVILRRHHSFVGSLIKTKASPQDCRRMVGALNVELRQLLSLATSIVDDSAVDESFDNYLKDATSILESRLLINLSLDGNCVDGPVKKPLSIQTDDSILKGLLHHLDNFFTNGVVVNLALTEVFASLASSNLVSLDGWLLVEPSNYEYPTATILSPGIMSPEVGVETTCPQTAASGVLPMIRLAYAEPMWPDQNIPLVPAILRKLAQQVERWRREITDFDVLVVARRELLHEDRTRPERVSRQASEPPTNPSSLDRSAQRVESGSPRGRSIRPYDVPDGSTVLSVPRSAIGSPLREPLTRTTPSWTASKPRTEMTEDIRRRLALPLPVSEPVAETTPPGVEAETTTVDGESEPNKAHSVVTLGHVLTNVVILHEFILELTAMVYARASLFQEVGYTGLPTT
ncbi:hypothetical protein Egran_05409 [Elaphomyces granulatus]|uniref:FHF complex subunit HOOK-interacting protein C-terminal domain-containing protein n=1 Tax=Elaphomyces granulatus TaxID=519963 RepID=A0A232LRW2_9EURO|nr:hypothetical protein Egran_05409 [Elaphomyces granulatus]